MAERESSVLTEDVVAFFQACLDKDERENLKGFEWLKNPPFVLDFTILA